MVDHAEPFTHLLTQGMVLKDGAVMSKSKGNVVDPDTMIEKVGADALRLYVMFVAPPEKEVEWTDSGLEAASACWRGCGGSRSSWRSRARDGRRDRPWRALTPTSGRCAARRTTRSGA